MARHFADAVDGPRRRLRDTFSLRYQHARCPRGGDDVLMLPPASFATSSFESTRCRRASGDRAARAGEHCSTRYCRAEYPLDDAEFILRLHGFSRLDVTPSRATERARDFRQAPRPA